MAESNAPFSFDGFENKAGTDASPPPIKILATDGIGIAVSVHRPPKAIPAKAALVFYHGGGAHSGAGYSDLGRGLAVEHDVAVYMPDLRGHGASEGPRGDAPSSEQVLRDVTSVIEHVRTVQREEEERLVPIFLGGHSSGAGLVVNYATWVEGLAESAPSLAGYVLVAPQLGYRSQTSRPRDSRNGRADFARVSILPFLLNAAFGLCGHARAVRFNYPPSVVRDSGVVEYNTVNVANAITPESPREQMGDVKRPVGLWIGSEDEIFVPERVVEYLAYVDDEEGRNKGEIVEGATHLGILMNDHVLSSIGHWITGLVK